MIIKMVDKIEEARICDKLLTKLIASERNFNDNIRSSFIVENWYERYYLEKNSMLFIAIVEEKIVAYIYIKTNSSDDGPTKEREAMIDGLYVEEEYRNRGIATKLIVQAINWAKEVNVKYITLRVLNQNEVAKKLYQHLDFCLFEQVLRKELSS